MILLEIAVAAPVLQTYSYSLPSRLVKHFEGKLELLIGRRVFVPFGPRKITGYIFGWAESEESEYKLKDIIEILDDSGLFHKNIIPVFKWVAGYYHYPIGEVVRTALPGGLTVQIKKSISLTGKKSLRGFPEGNGLVEKFVWLDTLIKEKELSSTVTKKILSSSKSRRIVHKLEEFGFLKIKKNQSKDHVKKKFEQCYKIQKKWIDTLSGQQDKTFSELVGLGKAEKKTVDLISRLAGNNYDQEVPRKELINLYPYGSKTLPLLEQKGVIKSEKKRIYRSPFGDLLPRFPAPEKLTEEQEGVLNTIYQTFEKGEYRTFLLNGVTGSGKTEVYLDVTKKTIASGKGALVLVPEIALATQVEAHFVSRFGDKVALLHSGLTAGERYDEWSRIYSGEASIVIGARSAVFAPIKNLGLIIVDEEHDSSFKQEDKLRYNSRDIAILRAKYNNSVAILGSATPSVTSYYHALTGKYKQLEMKKRVGGRDLPSITVIDLKKQKNKSANIFHLDFQQALSRTYEEGNQSILLLNRRGFSASVICKDCGAMVECQHCNVTLNMHKSKKRLVCHYCGYNLPENIICESCGSENLTPVGLGTERVEEEVRKLLPEAQIARLDSDTAVDRKKFLSILQNVRNNEVDVLVGTQMIAKGLHFPNVTLVGVVWADTGLAFPDYRAAEKTYQLIAQVTGRAGRGDKAGHVIIQTMQPEHYAIKLASAHRYHDLAKRELEIRENAEFPPFVRLVSIKVEGNTEGGVRNQITEIASESRAWCRKNGNSSIIDILGPAPAPIEKIKDMYRWQILAKGKNIGVLHEFISYLKESFQGKSRQKIIIDIDPENML